MRLLKLLLLLVFTFTFVYAANVETVLNRHMEARGGKEAFGKINSFKIKGTITTPEIKAKFELVYKYPNKIKNTIRDEAGASVYIIDGDNSYFKNAHTKDLLAKQMPEEMQANFIERSDFIEGSLINSKTKGIKTTFLKKAIVDNRTAYLIQMNYYYGKEAIACIDATTYEHYKTYIDIDSTHIDMFYSDYKEKSGIMVPFRRISKVNGKMIEDVKVDKLEINPKVDDHIFQDLN